MLVMTRLQSYLDLLGPLVAAVALGFGCAGETAEPTELPGTQNAPGVDAGSETEEPPGNDPVPGEKPPPDPDQVPILFGEGKATSVEEYRIVRKIKSLPDPDPRIPNPVQYF